MRERQFLLLCAGQVEAGPGPAEDERRRLSGGGAELCRRASCGGPAGDGLPKRCSVLREVRRFALLPSSERRTAGPFATAAPKDELLRQDCM